MYTTLWRDYKVDLNKIFYKAKNTQKITALCGEVCGLVQILLTDAHRR